MISSNDLDYGHWEGEITSWLMSWQETKIKPDSDTLPYTELIKHVEKWCNSAETFTKLVNELLRKDRLKRNELHIYNPEKTYKLILTLLQKLMLDVSSGGFTAFNAINYDIPKPEDLI